MLNFLYQIQWLDDLPFRSPITRTFIESPDNTIQIKFSVNLDIDFFLITQLPDNQIFSTPLILPDEWAYQVKKAIDQYLILGMRQLIIDTGHFALLNATPRPQSLLMDYYAVTYSAAIICNRDSSEEWCSNARPNHAISVLYDQHIKDRIIKFRSVASHEDAVSRNNRNLL